jgi:ell wall binding domain 2 (CWB2)
LHRSEISLRRLAAAALLATLIVVGIGAPAASAVTYVSNAKVVIIVGATEGATSTYRGYADQAYAEAIKYTPNVTKVYSPNATWTKVKAAAAGANILLYYGHGNGWPSPYTYDPTYTTKDGFGLNDPTNLTDSVHKYYGEPSVATLGLAPNAIVLLGNLCYASGNSEPGNPAPTVSVAHQRIDNYAAGFLKPRTAMAVIADGHGGLVSYIHGLFTTSQTIHDLWRSVADFHNHEVSFASSRTAGFTAYSDPDTTTGGYYRSLVTTGSVTTSAVTHAVGNTGADPTSLVVPGRAAAQAPDAPLYAAPANGDTTGAAPLLDLPAGTRLKTIAVAAAATATSPAIIQVAGLDDASIAGYVSADDLVPKDSQAPITIGISTGTGRLSPNGDGIGDTVRLDVVFSEVVGWTLDIRNGSGTSVKTTSGSGREAIVDWDGLAAGTAVADGTYSWTMRGTDAWKNGTASASGSLIVDTARLAGSSRFETAAAISASTFSPGVPVAYIAYAFNFPDALAAAAAAGTVKGPLLLASSTLPLDPSTAAELTRLKPARIIVLGGPSVVSDAVEHALLAYQTGG